MIIVFKLGDDMATWRPKIFPGSGLGGTRVVSTIGGFGHGFGSGFGYSVSTVVGVVGACTCPVQTAWPGVLVYDEDCPIHTEAVRNEPYKFPAFKR